MQGSPKLLSSFQEWTFQHPKKYKAVERVITILHMNKPFQGGKKSKIEKELKLLKEERSNLIVLDLAGI